MKIGVFTVLGIIAIGAVTGVVLGFNKPTPSFAQAIVVTAPVPVVVPPPPPPPPPVPVVIPPPPDVLPPCCTVTTPTPPPPVQVTTP